MKVMKNPPICTNKLNVWSPGNTFAPQVLRKIVTKRNPSIMSVYCQGRNAKSGFSMMIMASISVVTTKAALEVLAIHPREDCQPDA
jgi:hypothetical protein